MRLLSLRLWASVFGVIFCAGAVTELFASEDKVTLYRKDEVVTGRVKKEDLEVVEVEHRDPRVPTAPPAVLTYKRDEVAEVEWGVDDPEWREGLGNFKKGAYGKAADRFDSIIKDADGFKGFRAEVKPCLQYMLGESYYRSERVADAKTAFEAFMKDYKTSGYMPLVVGSLVDMAIQEKNFGKVGELLGELRKVGGEAKAVADFYEGNMFRSQGKLKEVDAKFSAAISGSSAPGTKGKAMMGQASCAIDEKNYTKARDLAQKALAANPTPAVAGAAHLIIGDAILAEVDVKSPMGDQLQNMLLDAALEYLRVQLQYPTDRSSEAKAVFKTGECMQRLSKTPGRAADRQRAFTMYSKVKDDARFRGTEWSKQAEDVLKKMR
jgi:TolA-binding protein